MQVTPHPRYSRLVAGAWCLVALLVLVSGTTWAAHFNYRVIIPDAVGEDVYSLQNMLKGLGFYQGELNERHDYATQEAVRRFQEFYRLPVTGWVDSNTAQALLSATNQEANIAVDGQYLFLAVTPKLVDGTLYVPVEPMTPTLGYAVEQISSSNLLLRFHAQEWTVTEISTDPSTWTAKRWNDASYLPLRTLTSQVGAAVHWDNTSRTAFVTLPHHFRPHQAFGDRFLNRLDSTSYPDRLRITFCLGSTTSELYTPGRLEFDSFSGDWLGQLPDLAMTESSLTMAINDPLVESIELRRQSGGLGLTISSTDYQLTWQWVLDPEHDRLILDILRSGNK